MVHATRPRLVRMKHNLQLYVAVAAREHLRVEVFAQSHFMCRRPDQPQLAVRRQSPQARRHLLQLVEHQRRAFARSAAEIDRICVRPLGRMIAVDEDEIVEAMRFVWERMKIIIEPSCATAVAVAWSSRFARHPGLDRVGVVITGGNVDLTTLPFG